MARCKRVSAPKGTALRYQLADVVEGTAPSQAQRKPVERENHPRQQRDAKSTVASNGGVERLRWFPYWHALDIIQP